MILIGQYISPFVRRVGIAMALQGVAFEHRPWSTFGDADKIRPYSPVLRVPVLVLDDGSSVIESDFILDLLDRQAPEGRSLAAADALDRQSATKTIALAKAVAEKAVSLVYEKRFHPEPSQLWIARCIAQISDGLAALEADRAAHDGAFWYGKSISHADIMAAAAWRFVCDAHQDSVALHAFPALARHSESMEALPVFRAMQHVEMTPSLRMEHRSQAQYIRKAKS